MVNPVYLIIIYLLTAFTAALAEKLSKRLGIFVLFASTLAASGLALWQLISLYPDFSATAQTFTAGFGPHLGIVLQFGAAEAVILLLINFLGLMAGIYLWKRFLESGATALAIFAMLMLGANGLVLTRDIFNAFVFMEILSIASYALIGLDQNRHALSSGIKYMLAGGVSSALYLIGIVFVYRFSGTLNIDIWYATEISYNPAYYAALFLVAIGIFIELKPFPANGWALDLYQSVDSGLAAVISSISSAAMIYLYYKLMPLFSYQMLQIFAWAGLISFVLANLSALRQKDAKRLLGYSSTGQTGLIVFALTTLEIMALPKDLILIIVLGLFITNFFAKAGLFWLSGLVKGKLLSSWTALRKDYGLVICFAVFVFALMGFPPFPAFFAKWELVQFFVHAKAWLWLGGLLLGSIFEVVYFIRWFSIVVRGEETESPQTAFSMRFPPVIATVLLGLISYLVLQIYPGMMSFGMYPLLAFVVMGLLDFLPAKLKGILAIGLLSWWLVYFMLPVLPLMGAIFAIVLVGGGIVQIFAFMRYKGNAEGYFPLLMLIILAMGNLLLVSSPLEFFMQWELMSVAAYLLILKGKKSTSAATVFAIFSVFGAYLLLMGLSMLPQLYPGYPILVQAPYIEIGNVAAILMLLGFLIKAGALGLHYWLPDAYSEAGDETSSLLSAVVSKAGILGLLIVLIMLAGRMASTDTMMIVLGWIGVLTAFVGALMAVFQEDVKKLLAYSSMSQLGYVIVGLSLMSHLGWVSAIYLTVNHMLFKTLIFLAIAAVIMRTGTRNMYEMGGLIKKMPIAFISVLMGIIAVSGVPPLSGFGSKWFIYTSLLEQGRPLQTGLVFFSSAIAFLYLYRLIHTVFLGQAKPEFKDVKEAPIWLIIPQGIMIMAIMAISVFPNLITLPLSDAVSAYIIRPEWLNWDGYNISMSSPLLHGNWNGNLVMYVTMGVFIVPLIWLLLVNAKTQKVKQFNIVYAAERPYLPSTTHYAYNMFAPYQKALGFLVKPRISGFYNDLAQGVHAISATICRLYTGNGQTYLLHIFLYVAGLYLLLGAK